MLSLIIFLLYPVNCIIIALVAVNRFGMHFAVCVKVSRHELVASCRDSATRKVNVAFVAVTRETCTPVVALVI